MKRNSINCFDIKFSESTEFETTKQASVRHLRSCGWTTSFIDEYKEVACKLNNFCMVCYIL